MSNDRSGVVDQPTAIRVIEPERFHKSQKEPALLTDGEAGKAQYEQTMHMKRKAMDVSEGQEEPSLTDLPKAWVELMQIEWHKRNRLGKVLYPIWLAYSAFVWAMVLTGYVVVRIVDLYAEQFEKPVLKTPSIYKESERE